MGNPRLVFNSVNLDFPSFPSDWAPDQVRKASMSASDGAVTETVVLGLWDEVRLPLTGFADRAFFNKLFAWWAWARQGKQYAVALDSAKMVDTTLNGTANAGQKVVPLATTTGLSVNDYCLIRSADLSKEEIVQIFSISAGVSITAVDNLTYAYASGDTFRHQHYYPKAVSIDASKPFRELPVQAFDFDHRFREDRG